MQEIIHSTIHRPDDSNWNDQLTAIAFLVETKWSTVVDYIKVHIQQNTGYSHALLLCRILSEPYFNNLEKELNNSEKTRIQSLLKNPDQLKPDLRSLKTLEIQIKKTLIGQSVSNTELRQIITSLSAAEIQKFCKEFPEDASTLIQILDSNQLSDLYNVLPMDKVIALTEQAINREANSTNENSLFKKLSEFKNVMSKSLISGNLGNILAELPPQKENIIIDNLMANDRKDQLALIVRDFLPTRLLPRLKDTIIKEYCQTLTTTEKAEFLIAVDPDVKDFWEAMIAPEGSKIKEAIELELETIKANYVQVANLQRNNGSVQLKFFSNLKAFVNDQYPKEVSELTSNWVAEDFS